MRSLQRRRNAWFPLLLMAAALLLPHNEHDVYIGYIGPGAGFAFLGSLFSLVVSVGLGLLSFLVFPFRMLRRALRRRHGFAHAQVKKAIFLGLDGLDPGLTERYLAEGKLPNLAKLREMGDFKRLRTTFPSLSPVAWSTFATGVNPGRHNIFDFLNRNLKTYVPELSSAKVGQPTRTLKFGGYSIPLSIPAVEMKRKSIPFWKLLGKDGIGCTIIRVPITFPPEKFNGRVLSAMCTPDLRGTQGSFSYYSTLVESATYEGGSRYPLKRVGNVLEGSVEGPENSLKPGSGALQVPFTIELNGTGGKLKIQNSTHKLKLNDFTPWVSLSFHAAPGINVKGITRFLLKDASPEVNMYMAPVQIDPESPALPISHPSFYASYLAKLIGTYSTLGMAEDTWALNEGVIDEDDFLRQAYDIMAEREKMFDNALAKTRNGVVACVFDTSDRVQHMFFRYLDGRNSDSRYAKTIEDLYQRMDGLVGKALTHTDENTALFVLSDHGFCSFRRGINLNSWLFQNGYLGLKDGATESGPYFENVDWSRTKAYTFGLGGLYLNLKGREAEGIVNKADAKDLELELISRLNGLPDPQGGISIREAYAARGVFNGPYLIEAPDLIIGYNEGYRTSWDAAVGKVSLEIFEDNCKAWSGDHCVDPGLVPGVLFTNRKIVAEDPGIEDMAPTALELFGVAPPAWMEGRSVFRSKEAG